MEPGQNRALVLIKIVHTLVWALVVACIAAIPMAAWRHRWQLAAALSAVVWLECALIAANRGRCPLTNVAGRFTANREANFDIYLPMWLARWNKVIFGTIFACNEVAALVLWLRGS